MGDLSCLGLVTVPCRLGSFRHEGGLRVSALLTDPGMADQSCLSWSARGNLLSAAATGAERRKARAGTTGKVHLRDVWGSRRLPRLRTSHPRATRYLGWLERGRAACAARRARSRSPITTHRTGRTTQQTLREPEDEVRRCARRRVGASRQCCQAEPAAASHTSYWSPAAPAPEQQ